MLSLYDVYINDYDKKKICLYLICVLSLVLPVSFSYAFCPTPPQQKPYNHISGNIIKIDEPNLFDKVPFSAVRIWVHGTMHFTNADEQGYFFLNEVQNDKISLSFNYFGKSLTLDLGNIGWYQRIEINDIVLANGNVEYANINKIELKYAGE
ncbi:MAG: hypothetical protein Q8Q33_00365 [Chlamydiota bacterium]|nr:hypothetical protein [Chlamydiota bacterium]